MATSNRVRRRARLAGILAVLACILLVQEIRAATIWVAKDGTGDFEIVADAVEAAASGDTIRIRAGVYPETRVYQFAGGHSG